MPLDTNLDRASGLAGPRCRQIARGCSLFTILVGLAVLLGWLLDIRPLMSVLPGLVSMKPNTAVGLACAGVSLLLFTFGARSQKMPAQLSVAFAIAVLLLGAITLLEYGTGASFGIDQLLFRDHAQGIHYPSGRMAPITAANFVLLGLALVFLRSRKLTGWAHALAGVVGTISLIAILGYSYGVDSLFLPGNFLAVALHTAIASLVLCAGILCATAKHGFMRVVTGSGISGTLVRRYGLAAIFSPFLIGWLRLQGGRYGFYGIEFGAALFAFASAATFAILIGIGASWLRKAELQEAQVRERLREAHATLEKRVAERTMQVAAASLGMEVQMKKRAAAERANQQILDHSLDVICTIDGSGRFVQVSRACELVWGYTPEELIGLPFLDFVHPDDREKTAAVDATIMSGQAENGFENRYLRRDGSSVPMVWTANWSEEHQTNFCVARDITARKRMESELRHAKEAAESATKAKGDFLANMSHEIRTPMNGVIGMTSLLLDTKLDPEQHQFATTIHGSAESLLSVINDILDFSKIEAGKMLFEELDFDLQSTVQETLEMLASAAQIKGLELIGAVEPNVMGLLRGDSGRVRQVLTNLLGNAIKFTSAGEVSLRISTEEETATETLLRCEVKDTGMGMAPAVQAQLFEPFVQGDGSTSRKFGGTGLGLVICRSLVEAMHGSIGMESAPGRGSTFWFTMRLKKQPVFAPVEPQNPIINQRVLVVDDNATSRELLHQQIIGWHFRNSCARSGEEALSLMEQAVAEGDPYALAIIDSEMPGMDGPTLARAIKANPALQTTRLIMLTAFGRAILTDELCPAGVDACRQKPVRPSNLFNCMVDLLGTGGAPADSVPAPVAVPAKDETDPSSRRHRILVAEDNAVNQFVALGHLKKLGYQADIAVNGFEVLAALQRNQYDIVFMDCQMPGMDGYEATAAIHAQHLNGQRPWIIAMTAHSMAGDRERCLAAGMDDYLSKPARRPEIQAALARAKKSPAANDLLKD